MPTSYSNPHSTGDRRSMILISSNNITINGTPEDMFDGNTTGTGRWWFQGVTLSSTVWIQWDFLAPIVVDGLKFYEQSATSQGTWQMQGSNDATTFTSLGSSFGLGTSATTQVSWTNTSAYRYYRMVGVSGSTNGSPWLFQIEFSCSNSCDSRTDLTSLPAGTSQVRVLISACDVAGLADVISFQVNAVEQVSNGSFESGGGSTTGWTTWYGTVPTAHTYASESVTAPGGAGSDLVQNNGFGGLYELLSMSGLDLTQAITMQAYTDGSMTVAFVFESSSAVALDGVVCRPAPPKGSTMTLRSLTIPAQQTFVPSARQQIRYYDQLGTLLHPCEVEV